MVEGEWNALVDVRLYSREPRSLVSKEFHLSGVTIFNVYIPLNSKYKSS